MAAGMFLIGLAQAFAVFADEPPTPKGTQIRYRLPQGIKRFLEHKSLLLETLLSEPVISEAVRLSNAEHKTISHEEIQRLDERWIKSKGIDDFIKVLNAFNFFIKPWLLLGTINFLGESFMKDFFNKG